MRIRLSVLAASVLLAITCCFTAVSAAGAVPFPEIAGEISADMPGVFITEVPQWECGIFFGNRRIREGDTLTAAQLSSLTIVPYAANETSAVFSWLPICENGYGDLQTFHLTLRGSKNKPPETADTKVETYKNLAVSGTLKCTDPDGDSVTYSVIRAPRRGDVTIQSDGSFVYTPRKNKVGTDCFVFTATDSCGNQSTEASVTIQIQNPRIKGVFADMVGDPNEYEARYLRENEIFSGETIGDTLCFCPDRAVTGEDFLVMLMRAAKMEPEKAADGDWLSPWKEAALRAGLRTPVSSEVITEYEAASLVSSLLDLEEEISVSVFADARITSGSVSLSALEQAGIPCFTSGDLNTLTRREAAILICGAVKYLEAQTAFFPWE